MSDQDDALRQAIAAFVHQTKFLGITPEHLKQAHEANILQELDRKKLLPKPLLTLFNGGWNAMPIGMGTGGLYPFDQRSITLAPGAHTQPGVNQFDPLAKTLPNWPSHPYAVGDYNDNYTRGYGDPFGGP